MIAPLLLLAAFACEGIAALLGFGVFDGARIIGWVALGLAFGYAATLVAAAPWARP